jgi:predicted Rossmann fold flavoprotein
LRNILVIGAGPAGLFTAISCTTEGRNVTVLDKNDSPGKKLLMTGSGQCNLTNLKAPKQMLKHYFGIEAERFLKPALMAFDSSRLIEFFQKRGLKMTVRDDGKVFPATLSARDVLEVLLAECEKQGITVECNCRVTSVDRKDDGTFLVKTPGRDFQANYLAITTGGRSYPYTGSSGDGYLFAQKMGHTIQEPRPALSAVYIDDFPLSDLSGISIKQAKVSLWRNGGKIAERREDLLLTHTGLSGPAILHLSREILPGDTLLINLAGWKREDADRLLLERLTINGKKNVKNILADLDLPERLIEKLVELSGAAARTGAEIKKQERKKLERLLTSLEMKVSKTGDFLTAMMTRGGISITEVNSRSMESRLVPNLFFAGEVLDFDGETGGYNLQAAFSTGYLAGISIRAKSGRP